MRRSCQKCKNILVGPATFHSILGFLYSGAQGRTENELALALQLKPRESKLMNFGYFRHMYCKFRHSQYLFFANKLFISTGENINYNNYDSFKKCFLVEATNLDMRRKDLAAQYINNYIEVHTARKIRQTISACDIGDGKHIIIIGCLYFKCPWKLPFHKKFSSPHLFWINRKQQISTQCMYLNKQNLNYAHFKDIDCQALELPFVDEELSMLILLPDSKDGLEKLEKKLSYWDLRGNRKRMTKTLISVVMPKFRIESSLKLGEAAKMFGISEMFTDDANFSSLIKYQRKIRVQEIFHKLLIDVSECGVETKDCCKIAAKAPGNEQAFIIDHPFLFSIISSRNRIFMLGCCTDPRSTQAASKLMMEERTSTLVTPTKRTSSFKRRVQARISASLPSEPEEVSPPTRPTMRAKTTGQTQLSNLSNKNLMSTSLNAAQLQSHLSPGIGLQSASVAAAVTTQTNAAMMHAMAGILHPVTAIPASFHAPPQQLSPQPHPTAHMQPPAPTIHVPPPTNIMSTSLHNFDANGTAWNSTSSLSTTISNASSTSFSQQQQQVQQQQQHQVKLNAMPWFHGSISRDEAEHLLQPPTEGTASQMRTQEQQPQPSSLTNNDWHPAVPWTIPNPADRLIQVVNKSTQCNIKRTRLGMERSFTIYEVPRLPYSMT